MTPESLAVAFCLEMRSFLTADELVAVNEKNRGPEHVNGPFCASHEYCDANQAMIYALESLGDEYDPQSGDQGKLIDEAWILSKSAGFSL